MLYEGLSLGDSCNYMENIWLTRDFSYSSLCRASS